MPPVPPDKRLQAPLHQTLTPLHLARPQVFRNIDDALAGTDAFLRMSQLVTGGASPYLEKLAAAPDSSLTFFVPTAKVGALAAEWRGVSTTHVAAVKRHRVINNCKFGSRPIVFADFLSTCRLLRRRACQRAVTSLQTCCLTMLPGAPAL